MKCYEITKCSDKERETCYVWNSFREHPDDMEELKCWVLKGIYHEENSAQAQKCRKCKYYLMINRDDSVVSDYQADIAVIECAGSINQEKTAALEKVWDALKKNNKNKVLFDLSKVANIYSCGLSMLVKIHRETVAAGGMLVIAGGREAVRLVFQASKLTKILHCAPDRTAAAELFAAAAARKKEEEEKRTAEVRAAAAEAAKPKPKKFVPCWEYWNNRNPRNATACDECFQKINAKGQPCWIVEGLVEGVSFQFVNESCVDCRYFEEFGKIPQEQR